VNRLLANSVLTAILPPAQRCELCTARSRNHPAGGLHRYTRLRVNGQPVCRRHKRAWSLTVSVL
jgi:hypothetical protein